MKNLVKLGVVELVFATVAFGMGANMKGVNTIIHYRSSQSTDDYFQESGRSGGSVECAHSVVFWKQTDCLLWKQLSCNRDNKLLALEDF